MRKAPLWISAGLLTAAGLGLALYEVFVFGFPVRPAVESQVWTVQARFTANSYTLNPVPVPAAVWLFGTALVGLLGFGRRRKTI